MRLRAKILVKSTMGMLSSHYKDGRQQMPPVMLGFHHKPQVKIQIPIGGQLEASLIVFSPSKYWACRAKNSPAVIIMCIYLLLLDDISWLFF